MKCELVLLLGCCSLFGADLPIGDIAHVGFRVADLEKTRAFYTGTLHIEQAFDQKDASGKTTLAVFKINDDQFLEFSPGTPVGFTHLAFLTQKLEALRTLVDSLGLNPPELRSGRDRKRNFSIKDPDGHRIEFVQYEADSMQAQSRGKFSSNIVLGVSNVGLPVADREAASAFFQGKLGLAANQPVELLPPTATFRLVLNAGRDVAQLTTHDPDGLPIQLKTASR